MNSAIGEMQDGQYYLRGTPLTDLLTTTDSISVMWLAWTGQQPSAEQRIVLQACFIACIDHGVEPPSAHVTRTVASCGKPLADAVAAGLLTLGPRHGNAGGAAARWIREAVAAGRTPMDVAESAIRDKTRLPGLGHPEYSIDPRTSKLFDTAKNRLTTVAHVEFALEVSRIMTEKKQKTLPLNIDGAIGALMADMGAPDVLADALFIAARTIGLTAHALEESVQSTSYRRG